MFAITYENEVYQHWEDDFIFSDYTQAKQYLTAQGFREENRTFIRKDYNWSKYLKAYISPRKVFKTC